MASSCASAAESLRCACVRACFRAWRACTACSKAHAPTLQALHANECGGDPALFNPDSCDCSALLQIVTDAVERAEAHAALVEACAVDAPAGSAPVDTEPLPVHTKPRHELQQRHAAERSGADPSAGLAFSPQGIGGSRHAPGQRRPGQRAHRRASQPPGFFGRLVASLFGGEGGGSGRPGGRGAPGIKGGAERRGKCKPDMQLMEQLCGMGFSLADVESALVRANNDVVRALEVK